MGKIIRHLEYYGFPDQNVYIGLPNVDLSDIRETNKEQDKEINEISSATKDKADVTTVNSLSGKVDTLIEEQHNINNWLANGINLNKSRIESLEARDIEIVDKINEVADKIDPIYIEIENLSSQLEDVDERLTQHISESETFEEETNDRLDAIENNLQDKIDKSEAYDTFVKKTDVYTKQEVDDLIEEVGEGYATEDWVLSRGYITKVDADGKYASKARLNALEDRVGDIQTSLYNQYNELNSDLSQFKTRTNLKLEAIDNRLDTLEEKYDDEISGITQNVSGLTENVERNSGDINNIINTLLPNKADASDLNSLSANVITISNSLDNKVDKPTYERDKTIFGLKLDALDDKKVDKTTLNVVSGIIDDISSDLEQEIQDRINGDNALGNRIDGVNSSIEEIRAGNVERDRKISNVESGLTKEIQDRIDGDNSIIGTVDDSYEDTTIYGAKKYTDKVANDTLLDAKEYADSKDGELRNYIDDTKSELQIEITAKADKSYVNSVKTDLEGTINDKVLEEKNRALNAESRLESALVQETTRAIGRENTISTALTHTSNIVKALTDWDGDDRTDYTDVGNGIVDVMHREIHDMNLSLFGNASYNNYDNKIHFYTRFGDEVCSIDVSGFSTSVIESAWYEDGVIYIKFTNGDIVTIDVSGLIDEYDFEDGLQVNGRVVSVLKDPNSEEYLTISQDGIKISGIDEKIEEEKERAIEAENTINERIDNLSIDCGIY